MKKLVSSFALFVVFTSQIAAQHYEIEKSTVIYKEVDGLRLEMAICKPDKLSEIKLPAVVFFFGGGWVGGDPSHFRMQAEYFASLGMIAVCPDYRVKNRHGTTPFESVKDARSAMRYLKIHGSEMGIDTAKIVAAGGSAGGHLAACTAITDNINEDTDDLKVSPVPFALVLFNPVVDTGKRGYGQEKVEGREFEISPVHHIRPGLPPTLIMHGKSDSTVPYENVVRFKHTMKQEGNNCYLKGYSNQEHGFFNFSRSPKNFLKTMKRTEAFLGKYDLLRGSSWIKKYVKELKKKSDS